MASSPDDRSRLLGGLVCAGALLAGLLFLYGLAVESYWAIALPVAIGFVFVLWLVFWIGWTIATVRVEASGSPLPPPGGGPSAPTEPDPGAGAPGPPTT
jgi:hypothetical protein